MKILLITFNELLPAAFQPGLFQDFLNVDNGYSAIVVDDVEPAKNFMSQYNYPANHIFPFYDLKECVENIDYDCIVLLTHENFRETLQDRIFESKPKTNFFVAFSGINSSYNFSVRIKLNYYKKFFSGVHIFATGISYSQAAFYNQVFDYRLMNLAQFAQDLYYDYQIAKKIFSYNVGKAKYVLIGLAPYSFHYDLSKSKTVTQRILPYYIALNDVHNFAIPLEMYRSIVNDFYIKTEVKFNEGIFDAYQNTLSTEAMNTQTKIQAICDGYEWNNKNFPETVAENKKILDDYLSLCEKNNAIPIMFLPPFPEGYRKHFSKEKLAEFYSFVNEARLNHIGTGFIDGWKMEKYFSDADFADGVHLNMQGAKKFSGILNAVIKNLEQS